MLHCNKYFAWPESLAQGHHELSRKSDENISHFNPNQSAPSIYIMIEICYFSLYQWEIRIHLLWGKCFNIPHHCDPHLNQTKFNDLLPLTIDGVLAKDKKWGKKWMEIMSIKRGIPPWWQDSQHILYYTWYKSMREIRTCCEKWWSFLWAVCFRLEALLSGNCQYQIE